MHRHAFLIMAHNNWYTLEKLIRIIDAPWVDIYIHIDRKAVDFNQLYFKKLCSKSKIYFTKRHKVTWGNETQVKAEMCLFSTAYKKGPYYYYHFLSGSDLPLKPQNEIYDFFERNNYNFIYTEDDVKPFEWRLKNYINVFRTRWLPHALRKRLNTLSEIIQYKMRINRLVWLKTQYPILGKGHNWCDLTQSAVEKLMQAKCDIRKFTRFTHCSDEMYKQIILHNQADNAIEPISNINIRFIDWRKNDNHPRILTESDYDVLLSSASNGCLFARKFDEYVSRKVIDMLSHRLINLDHAGQ